MANCKIWKVTGKRKPLDLTQYTNCTNLQKKKILQHRRSRPSRLCRHGAAAWFYCPGLCRLHKIENWRLLCSTPVNRQTAGEGNGVGEASEFTTGFPTEFHTGWSTGLRGTPMDKPMQNSWITLWKTLRFPRMTYIYFFIYFEIWMIQARSGIPKRFWRALGKIPMTAGSCPETKCIYAA